MTIPRLCRDYLCVWLARSFSGTQKLYTWTLLRSALVSSRTIRALPRRTTYSPSVSAPREVSLATHLHFSLPALCHAPSAGDQQAVTHMGEGGGGHIPYLPLSFAARPYVSSRMERKGGKGRVCARGYAGHTCRHRLPHGPCAPTMPGRGDVSGFRRLSQAQASFHIDHASKLLMIIPFFLRQTERSSVDCRIIPAKQVLDIAHV